jgi:hypothetical protein
MEKPLESTAWKTETNTRPRQFEIHIREANCEKGAGTGSCSNGGFGTTGVSIQASKESFLPASM